jgi:Immunoglobulin I-set domain
VDRERVEVNENGTLEVICTADGQPEPNVRWATDRLVSAADEDGGKLRIERIQVEDTGNITCVAENLVGRVTKDFELVVNCK